MATPPLTLVIFGASGNLTAIKLIPALYHLHLKGRLPEEAQIVGVARTPLSDQAFRDRLAPAVKEATGDSFTPESWGQFAQKLAYVAADAARPGGMELLAKWFNAREEGQPGRRLYYLSVAPELYESIATGLGEAGMAGPMGDDGWRRLVIEKPFGTDLPSARRLNAALLRYFREDQVYRIDHYLGKETVQNILVFRFANTLFEPLWNNNYIDHVQITVSEKGTVGSRGEYYDRAGVVRDMFQNHLLQPLTLIGMEGRPGSPPIRSRNEKVKVLDSIPILTPDEARRHIVTGQYDGYRREKGVRPDSRTPTYAAIELAIENWRWRGVPFFLRSGKGLTRRFSEVVIQYRCPPHLMFPLPPGATLTCNRLAICVQPDEGIHLNFQSKVPDQGHLQMEATDMEFHYRTAYPDSPIPEAYERLLQDAIAGDASLFMPDPRSSGRGRSSTRWWPPSRRPMPRNPRPTRSARPARPAPTSSWHRPAASWLSLCHP
ncbi:MAG: glucose-6-phosphate dehydrogenase [Gemmataceae bacterium]